MRKAGEVVVVGLSPDRTAYGRTQQLYALATIRR
jgi:hypothetical protein